MEAPLKGLQSNGKRILLWIVATLGLFSSVARIATAFYYSARMPQFPDPASGRIYRTVAAYNSAVYVTRRELQWVDLLNYDLMTLVGFGVVLLALFVIIPKARREGEL